MKKIKRSKLIKFMSLTLAVVIVTGSVIGYNKFKANAENDINTQSEIENTEIIENYEVEAEANTSATVQRIRTTWVISATICKGATLDIGVKSDGKVSVGSSSSWKNVKSKPKYWENTKGQKSASYKSNFVITPCSGYKTGSRAVTNTALLQVYGDARTFEITSGV